MSERRPVEIDCPACGAESLLLRKPLYEGFTRVGETLTCAACGHVFADEGEVPYKGRKQPEVFSDADRSAPVEVFEDHEAERLCRHCANYVVNPFMQWCSLHRKEVEATDSCEQFAPRRDDEEES